MLLTAVLCRPCLQAIAQFCLLAVVGMLLGVLCGLSTSWLLEHIFRWVATACSFVMRNLHGVSVLLLIRRLPQESITT
jgi:ABC-type lipoprotein release transport system permease subunit